MAKLCNACGGAVCPDCGGCINHGECSCVYDGMSLEAQKQVLNALVTLTRLLQKQSPAWYQTRHNEQAVQAIEKAIGRSLVNGLVKDTHITECEISG